jgi:YbbR domain-containing protein
MSADQQSQFKFKINKKVTIFAVCVVVASIFWLLNALSKAYVISLAVPLTYTEVPDGYAITNQPPSYVQVRIEGDGFNLLSVDEDEHEPVSIITSELFPETILPSYKSIVTTKDLQKQLQRELGSSISILGVSHDSLQISIERLASKKLPISMQKDITVANGYTIADITLQPDSSVVEGPVSLINSLIEIPTDTLIRQEVSESFQQELEITLPSRFAKANPASVQVSVAVEELTEGTIKIPIKVLHAPDSLLITVYPSTVSLRYTVPLSQFQQVSAEQFSAYVNFADVSSNNPSKLRIVWGSMPSAATRLDYEPKRVEYIIRKR